MASLLLFSDGVAEGLQILQQFLIHVLDGYRLKLPAVGLQDRPQGFYLMTSVR
jgi:hypothetical protein